MSEEESMFECPELHRRLFCLNGGTCFSLRVGASQMLACSCKSGFSGLRCDSKYAEIREKLLQDSLQDTSTGQRLKSEPSLGAKNLEEITTKQASFSMANFFSKHAANKQLSQQQNLNSNGKLIRVAFFSALLC